jgi:Fe-S-cluster-containing hydrogenase component 2
MLANYGYTDGSGEYFITVDTDRCIECADRPCTPACPAGVLEIIEDDYGDEVCAVTEAHRKQIKYSCAPCKPAEGWSTLPCMDACPNDGALAHSW